MASQKKLVALFTAKSQDLDAQNMEYEKLLKELEVKYATLVETRDSDVYPFNSFLAHNSIAINKLLFLY